MRDRAFVHDLAHIFGKKTDRIFMKTEMYLLTKKFSINVRIHSAPDPDCGSVRITLAEECALRLLLFTM